jgi:hypothetical protein
MTVPTDPLDDRDATIAQNRADAEIAERVADALKARGLDAHCKHTGGNSWCVCVTEPTILGTEWVFGIADDTWGAWLCAIESGERYREFAESPGVYVDTTVWWETDDVDAIARAIVGGLALRLDDAIAAHYARQQEGLPPPLPSTMYLWQPHRRWLRTFFPLPRPVGGWPHERGGEQPPPFDDWLRSQGITPAVDLYREQYRQLGLPLPSWLDTK